MKTKQTALYKEAVVKELEKQANQALDASLSTASKRQNRRKSITPKTMKGSKSQPKSVKKQQD